MTMRNPVAALIIQPDGTAEIRDIEPSLQNMNALVGGYLTAIAPATDRYGNWHAYLDEEGLLKGVEPNPMGTAFARAVGWKGADSMLVGPMVFLGTGGTGEDAGAEEADVPIEVVGVAVRLWGLEE